jgi:hypothetical protein
VTNGKIMAVLHDFEDLNFIWNNLTLWRTEYCECVVCLVHLSVRMEQLGSHWTDFHQI